MILAFQILWLFLMYIKEVCYLWHRNMRGGLIQEQIYQQIPPQLYFTTP